MRVRWSGRQLTVVLTAAVVCVILTGGVFALVVGRQQARVSDSVGRSASAPSTPSIGGTDLSQSRSGSTTGARSTRQTTARGVTTGAARPTVARPSSDRGPSAGFDIPSGSTTPTGSDGPSATGTPSVPAPAAPQADASIMAGSGAATTDSPGPGSGNTGGSESGDGAGEPTVTTGPSLPAAPPAAGASAAATARTSRTAADGGPAAGPSTNLTVQLSDQARRTPRAADVAGALQRYFDAINAHDYQGWVQAVAPNLLAPAQSEIAWMSGFSTTTDSSIWIRRITGPSGGLPASAEVRFTSQQEVSQAPADLQAPCIVWQLVYHFADAPDGTGLVIDRSSASVSHAACG